MRVLVASRWLVVSCLVFLASCGGSDSGSSHGAAPSNLALSPAAPSLTVTQYTTQTLVIRGTLSPRPAKGTVYISVDDDNTTFYSSADISGSENQFTATLHSGPWLGAGTRSGTLTVKICEDQDCNSVYPGYTATVPYTVTVQTPPGEVHRLLPSALAVAFADTPNGSVLSRTLWVHDNFGLASTWSASSDAAWLTVTPSGQSEDSNLVLLADPSLLPLSQTSVANVRVSSPGAVGATIRVGLWRDADGSTQMRVAPTPGGVDAIGLARDPYRPLVYASVGNDQVLVYNAHTGLLERTIAGLGTALTSLAVSPDGTRLYGVDGGTAIAVVDLTTDSLLAKWPKSTASYALPMQVIQPNGDDIVLLGDGTAMARGVVISTSTGLTGAIAATEDGMVAYSITPYSPSTITSWLLGYSNGTGQLQVLEANSASNLGGGSFHGEQIALSGDGGRLYVADYTGGCMQVDPISLALVSRFAQGRTTGVAMGTAGNVACGFSSSYDTDPDIAVFSGAGVPLSTFATSTFGNGVLSGELAATADGLIAVGAAPGVHELLFAPMGQASGGGGNHAVAGASRSGIRHALAMPSRRR